MKIWTKEQQKLLGLNTKAFSLIQILNKEGKLNTSELSYQASLPRVTVMRILASLKDRGFVSRKEVGREVLWAFVPLDTLEEKFGGLLQKKDELPARHDLSEVGSLTIYRGAEHMLESNRRMLAAHAGERVLAIEPNGIWKHFGEVQSEAWTELNTLWKKKQILVEMIAEQGFEKVIKDQVHAHIEESFLALVVDTRLVPKGVLDSTTEILIFRDQILFMDWSELVAVEIKNPSTVRVMRAMYKMMQKQGVQYEKLAA